MENIKLMKEIQGNGIKDDNKHRTKQKQWKQNKGRKDGYKQKKMEGKCKMENGKHEEKARERNARRKEWKTTNEKRRIITTTETVEGMCERRKETDFEN